MVEIPASHPIKANLVIFEAFDSSPSKAQYEGVQVVGLINEGVSPEFILERTINGKTSQFNLSVNSDDVARYEEELRKLKNQAR